MSKLPFALAGLALAAPSAFAQATWTTLGSGTAHDMSDDGTAATGNDFAGGGTFVWTQSGGQVNIGQDGGVGVSDDGTFVHGQMDDGMGNSVAGVWDMTNGWVAIGGLGAMSGTSISSAYGMSGVGGLCTGLGWITAGTAGAYRWMPGDPVPSQLPNMGPASWRGNNVSNDGAWTCGWDRNGSGTDRAAIWDVNNSYAETLILVSASNPDGWGGAWGFSDNNEYVAGNTAGEGFVWDSNTNTHQMTGSLPSGDPFALGEMYSVSNDGQRAVGFYRVAFPFDNYAVIWTPGGGLVKLKEYLEANGATGVPNLTTARVISGDGTRVLATDGLVWGIAELPAGCTSGETTRCQTSPNSVGSGALISSNGDHSIASNNFTLSASLVPDQFGVFYYGDALLNGDTGVPFGDGWRCVSGPQVFRLGNVMATGNTLTDTVDFTNLQPAGQITAGSTWFFQAWYRDPAAMASTFNLSDALEVTFCD